MTEEQLKAAEIEATAQVKDGVEEIEEDDLDVIDGGCSNNMKQIGLGGSYGGGIQ